LDGSRKHRVGFGLSGKLLALAVLFVMLAEVLIFVPSIANFRLRWLEDRLGQARTAALVLDAAPSGAVPEPLAQRILQSIGAEAMALKTPESRRLLAQSNVPPAVDVEVDLREPDQAASVIEAFRTLLAPKPRMMRVIGPALEDEEFVEIVLPETKLRKAMLAFSRNIMLLSVVISGIVAILLYVSLDRLIVRPVRRLTGQIVAFGEHPEDQSRILVPTVRGDEIGVAERELAGMQRELHNQLQQKTRLAALGLAVSKINHDLRNLLASAQLILERIGAHNDPAVQRWVPKLVAALDRAVGLAESTLSYGRVQEPPPNRQRVTVATVVGDVREALGMGPEAKIGWVESIERGLAIDADPDQLFRVLLNICRNAVQALESLPDPDPSRDQVRIAGRREGSVVVIEVSDSGPGVPEKARKHLFEPFQSSTRTGGAGLGLAIAAELLRAHGGSIELVDGTLGATFRIAVPDRPVDLGSARAQRRA
jgi:signal transduction histidine kinase